MRRPTRATTSLPTVRATRSRTSRRHYTAAINDVHDPVTGTPDPIILLGGYQAEATYNGAVLNVLDVALQPPFESGVFDIDNLAGVTVFNAIAPLSASWPIDPLAFLKLRLVGCVFDETVLTLNSPRSST